MLKRMLRILNFDDSITRQQGLLADYPHEILDLREYGPAVRCWMNKKSREIIARKISGSSGNALTFLGSGDFHHLSEILISRFAPEPISVIIFDNHPDWETLPPRFGCGSWVSKVLRQKHIVKLLLLGSSARDIFGFSIHSANLAALEGSRLEIYPFVPGRTRVFFRRVPENISLKVESGLFCRKICWSALREKDLREFFLGLISRLPARRVYLSVDKDCLKQKFALTNWEAGGLSLEQLKLLLKLARDNLDIAGMDITGDYSPIRVKGALKKIASYFDHPGRVPAELYPQAQVAELNQKANLEIAELMYA